MVRDDACRTMIPVRFLTLRWLPSGDHDLHGSCRIGARCLSSMSFVEAAFRNARYSNAFDAGPVSTAATPRDGLYNFKCRRIALRFVFWPACITCMIDQREKGAGKRKSAGVARLAWLGFSLTPSSTVHQAGKGSSIILASFASLLCLDLVEARILPNREA